MNATVTLYRYYFKSIEIEVDKDHLKGLTKEEIAEKLINGEIPYDEESVHNTSLSEFTPDEEDTDRYDIFTEDGDHVYGGHL